METEGACLYIAVQMAAYKVVNLFVCVKFVGSYVNDNPAFVRYNVVLCAGVYYGNVHYRRSKKFANPLETVRAQPAKIIQSFINGIYAFASGSMSRFAMGCNVEHH